MKKESQNLPGLNADLTGYVVREFGKKKFREIPFADWLPSDFVDVLCTTKDNHELHVGYYSPIRNVMVLEYNGRAREFSVKDLNYWLKVVA